MFLTYNKLFGHLDNEHTWLRPKRKAWKGYFFPAIDAAREKFCTYYGATEGRQGRLYNLGTVLNPTCKLTLYDEKDWEQRYAWIYKRDFFEHFQSHYAKKSTTFPQSGAGHTDLALLAQTY